VGALQQQPRTIIHVTTVTTPATPNAHHFQIFTLPLTIKRHAWVGPTLADLAQMVPKQQAGQLMCARA
jgi:hypothetical protein